MITKQSTLGMTREDWLNERNASIGGSDAAALLSLNDYSSPYQLWLEKTGQRPGFEGNIATETGNFLEPYIADLFTRETGKKLRRINAIIRNSDYPFAHANVDREVVGERALVECKSTTSLINIKLARTGDYPAAWYTQCMHYLMVTGYDRCYLAVLINNRDFHIHEISRDEMEIAALAEAEQAFWQRVIDRNPPPLSGAPGDTEALTEVTGPGNADLPPIDLFGAEDLLTEWDQLTESIKALDQRKEAIKQSLCQQLGQAEIGLVGERKVRWQTITSSRFDRKAFEAANPGISLLPWTKTSTARRFEIR